MRSPNKRSRSKSNRPKTLGNIVNRVFDSSGPEGKVRGTPQQIIEKYQVLARDAQLSNDRVAAENFQQHAEHYTRLLAQAQREMQAEQDARRQQHEERQRQASEERNAQDRGASNGHQNHNRRDAQRSHGAAESQASEPARGAGSQGAFAVQEDDARPDQDSLVETPESQSAEPAEQPAAPAQPAKPARKPRAPRAPRAATKAAKSDGATGPDSALQPEAGSGAETESAAAKPARRNSRKPRQSGDAATGETSHSAAE